jgi:tripeptidyl-peptidase-2
MPLQEQQQPQEKALGTAATVAAFPIVDLVPKKETKALEFVETFPDYNGKNVLIGILDTGIDPGAAGIRYMADGVTPKLVDLVDCTGSGDVDVSTERSVTLLVNDNDDDDDDEPKGNKTKPSTTTYQVEGLSKRLLTLNPDWWKAAAGDEKSKELPTVQLGIKRAYELFPESLVNRVKAHRKIEFDKKLNKYMAEIRTQLSEWQEKYQDTTTYTTTNKPTPEQLRQKEDLQARMDVLNDKEWEDDPGLMLDCIVFFDGQDHRAVICTGDETTDLTQCTPLAAYSKERQYATISTVDQYNYGVQFYDNAKVLSIVGDCTPHGTHVAAIAAAAEGERSGVAPGAQLISLKIGDSRLGSMETGSSICRGIMTAIRLGCDVINLSYGEGCQLPNAGRVIQFAEELVWRHNIVFVSAVGNNGPALTTVNAPGGMSSCILGVAAYVSPEMMKAEYSLLSNADDADANALVGTTYTWSSVGPAADGSNGVSVCAPGGAITSVSNWTMQKSMLMNGTSMASPHACGCVALLLSACKAEGIPISPTRIQRAIENTTKTMDNLSCLQQGWGMIQVDRALEHLKKTKDLDSEDVHFEVVVDNRSSNPRGIYLRQPVESATKHSFSIRVNPKFRRMDPVDEKIQRSRIEFEVRCSVQSTASWVSAPDHFMLMNNGRAFKISVDPTNLSPGVHTAKVCGSDADHPERGVIWSVPITVVKPMKEEQFVDLGSLEVRGGHLPCVFLYCIG